jgi:hypothetical protein
VLPGGRLLLVGRNGLFATWRGSAWVAEPLPQDVVGEDWLRISAIRERPVAVLGRRSILLRDSSGAWTVVAAVPAWMGSPRDITVFPHGGLAVVGDELGVWSRRLGANVFNANLYVVRVRRVTRVLALSDGRLVAASADPGDPLLGGGLYVSTPFTDSTTHVRWRGLEALPARVDVYDLSELHGNLHIVGSGWFHHVRSLGALVPAPDSAKRN